MLRTIYTFCAMLELTLQEPIAFMNVGDRENYELVFLKGHLENYGVDIPDEFENDLEAMREYFAENIPVVDVDYVTGDNAVMLD